MTKKTKPKNEKNETKEIHSDPTLITPDPIVIPDEDDTEHEFCDILDPNMWEFLHVALNHVQSYQITRNIRRMINGYYADFCSGKPFNSNPLFDLLSEKTDTKKLAFRRSMATKLDEYLLAKKKRRK